MTALAKDHVAMPDPEPSRSRPAWVTDDVADRLVRRVFRPDAASEAVRPLAPYDESLTIEVPSTGADGVVEAVAAAREAQAAWQERPFRERAGIVLRFHDLLVERQKDVLDLIQWETGKSRFSAWQEILQVANIARHYARRGPHYLADHKVRGAIPGLTKVKEVRVPKGVVGVISPWNYPLYLAVGDVLPALLAGNGAVSKADSQTPLTLLWAHELMAEAGLPEDLWHVVVGRGSVVGTALIDSVDYVCFTGSTATGRTVARQAGERLIGCSLELGGKNPLIVRADADIDKAVDGTVAAAFANTGQMCISIERVLVHESVYDGFAKALAEKVAALRVGQTYDYSVDVGTLTSADQLKAVSAHVDDAVAKGATVLAGGRARPDLGPYCYEPTVLADITGDMTVCGEETFGPVVSLYRFGTDHEALALANEGSYGLSASIWSRDVGAAAALAPKVRAGSVNVNDGAAAAAGSIEAHMGGMGDSGLGRRHGSEGIRKYTEPQTLAVQRLIPLGPHPSMTVEKFVDLGNKQLRLLRRLKVR
jgi:succinate-semialdehyde dehydrogenase / glutarate-semialdehyde dehydrogenase